MPEHLVKQIAQRADELGEMCDSVVIITTSSEGEETHCQFATRGNMYACMGSVAHWLRERKNYSTENSLE